MKFTGMCIIIKKAAKIRNKYNQEPLLTQDTTWESDKITNKWSDLSQQVTTRQQ